MCGFSATPLEKIRVGIIGLGMRGKGAVKRLSKIRDVEIVALCDLREEMVLRSQKLLKEAGRPAAQPFFGKEQAWKALVDLELDLVYIATPWRWHTPMCVYAMQQEKTVMSSVGVNQMRLVKLAVGCWIKNREGYGAPG